MKIKTINSIALLALVLFTTSCVRLAMTGDQRKLYNAEARLEQVEESQNESGKIAVSELEFVANKGQFNINYNEDPSNYVQAARVNISGDASSSVQTAYYLGTMLQAAFAAPISTGQPAGTNNPLLPQTTIPNQAETAVNGFTAPPALNATPTTDERDAVEKGINDKLAEEFLRFMSNPEVNSNDEAIVFGVMQATCEPGQQTRKGYIAELDIGLKYARTNIVGIYTTDTNRVPADLIHAEDENGNSITIHTNKVTLPAPIHDPVSGEDYYAIGTDYKIQMNLDETPDVLAVLPLMDTRNMALQNNNQSQVEIAAALSAAFEAKGLTAAASILSDYVKRQQSSIETLNSLPVTTTYSDGSDFGFQLYPSLEAIENPDETGSPAADVLEPVTFPIVVAIKVKKNLVDATNNAWNLLDMETQTRWIPMKPLSLLWRLTYGASSFPEMQRELRAYQIDTARAALNSIEPDGEVYPYNISPMNYDQYRQAQIALDSLESSALSTESFRELPDPNELFPPNKSDTNAPTITDVFPHTLWRNKKTDMLVLVNGVTNADEVSSVMIAGRMFTDFKAVVYGYTNIVAVTNNSAAEAANTTSTPYIMTDTTTSTASNKVTKVPMFAPKGVAIMTTLPEMFYSITNTATNNVDFAVVFKSLPPATKTVGMLLQGRSLPQPSVTLTRDANSRLLGINIQPGSDLTGTNLLDLINTVLLKSEPPPKTVNIIH